MPNSKTLQIMDLQKNVLLGYKHKKLFWTTILEHLENLLDMQDLNKIL